LQDREDARMRDYVKRFYAGVARGSAASEGCGCGPSEACCSPEGCCSEPGSSSDTVTMTATASGAGVPFLPRPVSAAALRPGERVLDVGSGLGGEVFEAASLVGPSGEAIGVDFTEEMVRRATAAAKERGITNARFLLADAESIPLPDSCVDVVLSNCVLNLSQNKAGAFRECFRVLGAGGGMVIGDVVTDRPLPEAVRNDPQEWACCIVGAVPFEEYEAMIRDAGFPVVQVVTRTPPIRVVDRTTVYGVLLRSEKKR